MANVQIVKNFNQIKVWIYTCNIHQDQPNINKFQQQGSVIILFQMNRICLKRKQAQRKTSICTLADQSYNENVAEPDRSESLSQISNSPAVSKVVVNQTQNQRMFEQFKIQYDQLRNAYQSQRISYDQIMQQKKRLEIQILNNNPEFYDKEIKRLRGQVQKLQEQNEDNKHKYIVAENSKKQLEATVKVRNEQIKRTIQLLEKEKVTTVELKHQLNEKQKLFQRITNEMQKSGNVLSQSFQDANSRIQKLEFSLKNKSNDLDTLQRNYDHLAKKLNQTQRTMKANKQIFDQTNFKKSQIIDQLETKLRTLNRSSRDTIQGLQSKIEEFKTQRKTQNLLIDQQIQVKKNFKQQRITQLQIVRLQQLNKQAKLELQNKVKLIKNLEEKLQGTCSIQQYQQLEKKIKQIEIEKAECCKKYEQRITKLEKQLQNQKFNHFRNPAVQQGVASNFQQLLKVQLEQNAKVKRELALKIDEVYNLKSDIDELKCKLRVSQDQIGILNKKIKSQQKNYKIQNDVTSQNLKNDIDSLKRKVDMLQTKVEQKTKQIKEKQNFIMTTIIGRSRQEQIPLIIAEMQRIFQADYVTRLYAANQKIEELEKRTRVQ